MAAGSLPISDWGKVQPISIGNSPGSLCGPSAPCVSRFCSVGDRSARPPAASPRGPRVRLAAVSPRDFVYVDTETTGLGGAGALVFLAGVARFDGSMLRLRQYLLPAPHYEGGLLGGLAEELANAGALVSYNGKSFDLPLLE